MSSNNITLNKVIRQIKNGTNTAICILKMQIKIMRSWVFLLHPLVVKEEMGELHGQYFYTSCLKKKKKGSITSQVHTHTFTNAKIKKSEYPVLTNRSCHMLLAGV